MFGVKEMLAYIDEFVSWFLIRKVIMPLEQTEQTIEDVRGFVQWLAESGEIGTGQARKALGAIATASIDVPSAERLAHILHDPREEVDRDRGRSPDALGRDDRGLPGDRTGRARPDLVHRRCGPDQGPGGGQCARPSRVDGELSRRPPRYDLAVARDRQRLPRNARLIAPRSGLAFRAYG